VELIVTLHGLNNGELEDAIWLVGEGMIEAIGKDSISINDCSVIGSDVIFKYLSNKEFDPDTFVKIFGRIDSFKQMGGVDRIQFDAYETEVSRKYGNYKWESMDNGKRGNTRKRAKVRV
jgi:hypothetical protein